MVDGTDAVTFSNGDFDEAIDTPVSAPRVTDKPVLKSACLIGAIADNTDSVISADAASLGVEDTTGVVVEDSAASVNGDGDWLLGDSNFHAGGGLRLNANVGGESHIGGLGLFVRASAISGSVSIVTLEVRVVVHQIRVGIISHATIASVIGSNTVNELLLRKGDKSRAEDGVGTLD